MTDRPLRDSGRHGRGRGRLSKPNSRDVELSAPLETLEKLSLRPTPSASTSIESKSIMMTDRPLTESRRHTGPDRLGRARGRLSKPNNTNVELSAPLKKLSLRSTPSASSSKESKSIMMTDRPLTESKRYMGPDRSGRGRGRGRLSKPNNTDVELSGPLKKLSLRSTPSASSSKKSKLIMVTVQSSWNDCDFHTAIYSIDIGSHFPGGNINRNRPVPLEPVFCLDDEWPVRASFVITDDILYMFGGMDLGNSTWVSSMYTHDMSLRPFHVDQLKPGPNMCSPKIVPKAVLVNHHIFVFSTAPTDSSRPNFELYNPHTSEWSSVSELFEYSILFPANVFCWYVSNFAIYLWTTHGIYFMSFDILPLPKMPWAKVSLDPLLSCRASGPLVDDFYFGPLVGLDLSPSNSDTTYPFQILDAGNDDDPRNSLVQVGCEADVVYLGRGKLGEIKLGIITVGVKDSQLYPKSPSLLVDMVHCFVSPSRDVEVVKKEELTFQLTKCKCLDISAVRAFVVNGLP